jgi:DNA-binding NarL/FixJ family response regulator
MEKGKYCPTGRCRVTTRFMIAEDNDFFRETIVQMLSSRDGAYTCVGQARDGAHALELVDRTAPDLLILDLRMPRMDGIEVLDFLRQQRHRPRTLVLTMNRSQAMMQKAFDHGADGYCTKTCGREALFEAVDRVAIGHRYTSPDMPLPETPVQR